METGLEGKPIHYGIITAVVTVGVFLFMGHYLVFKDMKNNITRQQAELADLQGKIQEGRTAERSLEQFREEVRRLELELSKLLKILPSKKGTDDLLRRVRALTEQGDFDLISFAPGSPRPLDDFYSEWPITIQLRGGYHNLAQFFDRISRFRRIINVDDLRINRSSDRDEPRHTITARFTAKTFLSQEQEAEEEEF